MTDFEKLTDFHNLYNSYVLSLKRYRSKKRASRFRIMALEQLYVMRQELVNRTYKIGNYYEFVITDPKCRVIKAGSFRDKVLQHCLCDYVLLPKMSRIFIRNNFAGQTGKGTLFGLDTLSSQLSEYYEENGCFGYILKCDINKFYYSITHDSVRQAIRLYFDDEGILWICDKLIDSTQGDGLPLGNQASQIFALILMHGLDIYITEKLGCKLYGRYVDDFYLISDDKQYLQECLRRIRGYLSGIGLSLNNKTEIVPLSKGIRFLGFHTYLTNEGKVIRKLRGDNKRKERKHLRKNACLVKQGKMSKEEFNERYVSWKNHASHGNCYKLIQEMDMFVESLFS